MLDINLLAELVSIGTLYVFAMVCCGVLYRRYHQPGSPNQAAILGRILAIVASSAGGASLAGGAVGQGLVRVSAELSPSWQHRHGRELPHASFPHLAAPCHCRQHTQ